MDEQDAPVARMHPHVYVVTRPFADHVIGTHLEHEDVPAERHDSVVRKMRDVLPQEG